MLLFSRKFSAAGVLLATLVALIYAQDPSTVVFPSHGNASSFGLEGKGIESTLLPDVTPQQQQQQHPLASLLAQAPIIPPNYFPPEMIRPPTQHRSDGFPYGSEYPNFPYPVIPPVADHPVGLSSKHLVIVSFIGLLLLFAIIQNTIIAAKRKDALVDVLSARRKRDLFAYNDIDSMTPEAEAVWNDDARIRCIQRTICLENKKLFNDLGSVGKALAKYLTREVKTSLDKTSGWDRLVDDAGAAGIRGENCNVLYRTCNTSFRRDSQKTSELSADTNQKVSRDGSSRSTN